MKKLDINLKQIYCILIILMFMGVILFGLGLPAQAEYPLPTPSTDEINQIASQIYPPGAAMVPLSECTSSLCDHWRELISEQLLLGQTEDQIIAYFVEQYGEQVLGRPLLNSLNGFIYILPIFTILAAAYIIYRSLYSRKPVMPAAGSVDKGSENIYEKLFEDQIDSYEKHNSKK